MNPLVGQQPMNQGLIAKKAASPSVGSITAPNPFMHTEIFDGKRFTGKNKDTVMNQIEKYKQKDKYRLNQLRKELTSEASSFRQNLPQYTQQQYQGLLDESQRSLRQGTRDVRSGAASRGLLYSGIRQQAEGSLRSGIASQLSQSRANVQREAEQLARSKEEAAAATGLQLMMQAQQRAEELYNVQLANQVARREAIGQLAAGIGYGIGAYRGGAFTNNPSLPPSFNWGGNRFTPSSTDFSAVTKVRNV